MRENGSSGQGSGPQCSSKDSHQLAEGPDRVVREEGSPRATPGDQPEPQAAWRNCHQLDEQSCREKTVVPLRCLLGINTEMVESQ